MFDPATGIATLIVAALVGAAVGIWLWQGRSSVTRPAHSLQTRDDESDPLADRQRMMLALMDLGQRTVEEVMVPRSEVVAIDLRCDWDEILGQLDRTPHTRLPLFEGDLDQLVGVVHMKRAANELAGGRLDRKRLREIASQRPPVFVPMGTNLQVQLGRFRHQRRRVAFVVDEYGSIQGLLTLEDILEEVVGEFTTQPTLLHRDLQPQADGSHLIAGSTALRVINQSLGWQLPTDGPRTLGGLIVEYLESIPEPGTSLRLQGHAMEVLQVVDNAVRTVRVWPSSADDQG